MRNAAAALVAIVCWAGLAIQFSLALESQHSLVPALWGLARFFTILTSLLVALTMTWVAIGRRTSPEILGGLTLSTLLVGAVYWALLKGFHPPGGGAQLADILLHKVSPVLMLLWWLLFAPRGRLRWNAPARWVLYPLFYLGYVLVRSHFDRRYPYPFIDVAHIGWLQTMLNAGGIALAFIIAGLALVWIDTWLPLGSRRANG